MRRLILYVSMGGMLIAGCVGSQRVAPMENTGQLEQANLDNFDDLDFNV